MTIETSTDEKLKEAHARLRDDLAELERMLTTMTAIPADRLADRLRKFRGITAGHFQFEELNGYLNPVISCGHDKEVEVKALLDEHRRLLAFLDEVIDDAVHGTGLTGELRERLQLWLRDLRAHEGREIEFFDMARDDEPC